MPHVAVDGCRLNYRWDGPEGAPVLLLSNSLGTNLAMWDDQMPALAGRFRVLRYDSRGHGQSDAPPGPYGIERLGRDAVGLLDALGLDRVLFCGLSKGGMTGMWLGVHAPERVARLVLCNTAAYMGPPAGWDARIKAVTEGGMAAVAGTVVERWFTPDFQAADPAACARIKEMLLTTPVQGYAGSCAAVRDMDQREDVKAIRTPTLVIAGEFDPATPPELGEALAASIPGARLIRLPAAHLSNVEQPAAFTAALLGFLGEETGRHG